MIGSNFLFCSGMDLKLLLVLRSENESFPFYQLSLLNPSLSHCVCFHVHGDTMLCCLLINTDSGKSNNPQGDLSNNRKRKLETSKTRNDSEPESRELGERGERAI